LRVLIFIFSFLYAIETNVKISGNNLYVYVVSKKPVSVKIAPLVAKNGSVDFIKNFSFEHNELYFSGKRYKIYGSRFYIEPIIIEVDGKKYKTKTIKPKIKPFDIDIEFKKRSYLLKGIAIISLIYILVIILIYFYKIYEFNKKSGVSENDLRKFYFYLALNGFSEVEILNKDRYVFKKNLKKFGDIIVQVRKKAINEDKYQKEIIVFTIFLIIIWSLAWL
jgi:hypothetical protein